LEANGLELKAAPPYRKVRKGKAAKFAKKEEIRRLKPPAMNVVS